MTIQDFLRVDSLTLSRLTDQELKAIATGGRKIANERIKRLRDAEMTSSPAYQALPAKVKKAGGFRTAKVDRSSLLKQIQQEQQFVRGRTSTVTGWKKEQVKATDRVNEIRSAVRPRYGYNEVGQLVILQRGERSKLTVNQVNKFWNVFNKMQEDKQRGAAGSTVIQKAIYDTIKKHPRSGEATWEREVAARLDGTYKEEQDVRQQEEADILRGTGSKL